MTVMVDELKVWPHAKRPFREGSCHLTTNGPIDELHTFAASIGMKRAWFQPHLLAPHYDLTPARRVAALAKGAVEVSAREQARYRRDASGCLDLVERLRLAARERDDDARKDREREE